MQFIGGRWIPHKTIGSGGYGNVYSAMDADGWVVAVKTEPIAVSDPSLPRESSLYRWLLQFWDEAVPHIPRVHFSGGYGGHNVLVMDLLGPSLGCCLRLCGGRLSIKSVLMLFIQGLDALRFLHSKGILHRDIKPSNLAVGDVDPHNLYLVDLGLGKMCLYPDGTHIQFGKKPGRLIGTPEFGSANNDLGLELSRRDDLEALFYTMVFLYKGNLPWFSSKLNVGLKSFPSLKSEPRIRELCQGMPEAFPRFFYQVRSLTFQDKPNYEDMIAMLRDALTRANYVEDYVFEWMRLPLCRKFDAYKKKRNFRTDFPCE